MGDEHPKVIESQNKSYQIVKPLGEGGTSVVYLANDGKREVALKILGEEVDPAFKDRYVQILKNEFEVLTKLRHPNIAEVYDFEFAPAMGKYFFTTEYIKGTDVYNYTEGLDLSAKEDLFIQMLVALEYVHRCGVIHCDIKCGNALVTQVKKTPVLKLVDFGFATRRLASGGAVVGTAHYLAPELLSAERKEVDHRIDVYAAGILYYRLLHRTYPYEATSVSNILRWHKEKSPLPFSDNVPEYARQLITKMVATYPTDRVASCAKAIEFINLRTEGRYRKVAEKIGGLQFKEGPLVGRMELLEKAQMLIEEVKSGKSPSEAGFAITGLQGIGKSRLLREVKYRAELNEIPIKEFTCVGGQDNVLEMSRFFKEVDNSTLMSAEKAEDKRALAYVNWINEVIAKFKKSGLILMIDDVQFADSTFIKFMSLIEDRAKVKRAEGDIPLLLIVGSRPRSELPDIVGRWFDKSALAKIELAIFSGADIENYMGNVGISNAKKFVDAALSFSGGIPGLVEAYCQFLLSPGGMVHPPTGLVQSYLDRAKKLSKEAREVLNFVAVSKRNLTTDNIAQILSVQNDEILKNVQELISNGFVTMKYPVMDVNAANKAISQVIKTNMDPERLKIVSLSLGKWLEITDKTAFAEMAEYFDEAGASDYAECYAESAGKYYEERFNNSEAAKYYALALRHVKDEAKKKNMIRAVSKMNVLMGSYKDAIEKMEAMINAGDKTLENYRLLGMAYAKMRQFDRALKWYEEGLTSMTDETAITESVLFKNSLGNVYFYSGDLERSEKYFTEAIADATVCLLLNNNLGLILSSKGEYEQAIRFYDGRKRFLAAKQNKRVLSLCYADCGYIHMSHNHLPEAAKDLEESFRLASDTGDWYNILVITGNLVRCYQQMAEYSKALDYALKGLEAEANVGSIEDIAQNHLTIGILYETIGIFDLALQHINMAKDRFIGIGNMNMIGWCHLATGFVKKDLEKFDDAAGEFDAAKKIAGENKLTDLGNWADCSKADVLEEYGKGKEAASILNKVPKTQSAEFELRRRILELKLGLVPESEKPQSFERLIEECKGFPELKWEAMAAFATFLEQKGKTEEANKYFKQAYEVITSIAENLGEAYKDSYKAQRYRLKIVQRFEPLFNVKSAKPSGPVMPSKKTMEEKTSAIR